MSAARSSSPLLLATAAVAGALWLAGVSIGALWFVDASGAWARGMAAQERVAAAESARYQPADDAARYTPLKRSRLQLDAEDEALVPERPPWADAALQAELDAMISEWFESMKQLAAPEIREA